VATAAATGELPARALSGESRTVLSRRAGGAGAGAGTGIWSDGIEGSDAAAAGAYTSAEGDGLAPVTSGCAAESEGVGLATPTACARAAICSLARANRSPGLTAVALKNQASSGRQRRAGAAARPRARGFGDAHDQPAEQREQRLGALDSSVQYASPARSV